MARLDQSSRRGLPGGEDGIGHAMLGQQIEALDIDRRLCQPHAVGVMAIAMAKTVEAPQDLRQFVTSRCQGQRWYDCTLGQVHCRRHSVRDVPVGINNLPINLRMGML